ncbi:hypothetical protein SKAU_G00290750 [Synaphobranchus kaupii]|uniref:Uncharacterized protein n=1 Tax=Synaphobranchus kaupii TaxID=118154 RepID=A0A9Q1ETQ8_SYNKA|nr:hypothetical protein SKAU_G00290750 [Synaphobranchus kaupii]
MRRGLSVRVVSALTPRRVRGRFSRRATSPRRCFVRIHNELAPAHEEGEGGVEEPRGLIQLLLGGEPPARLSQDRGSLGTTKLPVSGIRPTGSGIGPDWTPPPADLLRGSSPTPSAADRGTL